MNILIFTDTFLPKVDGVVVSVEGFSQRLVERGHSFTICCPAYGEEDVDSLGESIRIVRFRSAPLPSYPDIKVVLPSHKKIRQIFTDFAPDLVHIQTPGLLGQYGALAARMYDVPLIGTYHTLVSEQHTYLSLYRLLKLDTLATYFRKRKKISKRLDKIERRKEKKMTQSVILRLTNRLYDRCRLIISPTALIRDQLIRDGLKRPIYVVSNGIDLALFHGKARRHPGTAPKLLHVGRISYEKNVEVILRAFAILLERYPEATLDIYGDGPALAAMKLECRELSLEESVHFRGFVERSTLPAIYPQYDLFLTASTMETQGLVVLEALASGLPAVGVNAYALPELIVDGRNGFCAEPFAHRDIAERLLDLLGDPELYERFSAASLEIATKHDMERCSEQLEVIYEMIVRERRLALHQESLLAAESEGQYDRDCDSGQHDRDHNQPQSDLLSQSPGSGSGS